MKERKERKGRKRMRQGREARRGEMRRVEGRRKPFCMLSEVQENKVSDRKGKDHPGLFT